MARENGRSFDLDNRRADGNAKPLPVDWEHLARSTAHPLRIAVLEILGMDGGRVLSPNELSLELQLPLSNTNYHVTELAKAELIVLAATRQVRGATEHFYELPAARRKRLEQSSGPARPAQERSPLSSSSD